MPISDCEVRDPRIKRTRQLLQNALRMLMQAQSLDEISVQDITETATINRATFYDHYNDKFDLFEALIAGEFHQLLDDRKVTFDEACPQALAALILAACDYLTQTQATSSRCDRQGAFEPLFGAAVTAVIQRVLQPGIRQRCAQSKGLLPPEIIAGATSSAIYGALREWSHSKNHSPANEIVKRIVPLIVPMMSPQH